MKGKLSMKKTKLPEMNEMESKIPPLHPGEVLLEEFLNPLGITQYRLAKAIDVPARRINEIVHGLRGVTADTALRLSRFFGTSAAFWLNLQNRYDLDVAEAKLGAELNNIYLYTQDPDRKALS